MDLDESDLKDSLLGFLLTKRLPNETPLAVQLRGLVSIFAYGLSTTKVPLSDEMDLSFKAKWPMALLHYLKNLKIIITSKLAT